MSIPNVPASKPPHRIRIARRTAFLLGLVVVLVVYPFLVGVLPWALSLLTPRYGWTEGGPAIWNLLGLVLVGIGIVGLVWVFSTMFAQFPKLPWPVELDEGERPLTATSRILITHGPFAFSRNPMFLSGLIVLLGWAVFYGSVAVLLFVMVGWVFANYLKVPQEERGLEARFGDVYRDYQKRVPRWLGIPRTAVQR
jgi:protein-S-isoprenylcysteine O-methyltransferase Ste14